MENLKPCPFCGRIPTVDDCGDHSFFVRCKCGIVQDKLYMQKCDAIRRWNSRKIDKDTNAPITENDLPSAQSALYGYDVESLKTIAMVLREENMPPERVMEVLMDTGRIIAMVKDEFEKSLRKAVEQCVTQSTDRRQ